MKKGRLKKLNYLPIFQLDTITILFLIKQVEHYTEGKYDFLATVQVFWIIKNYFFGVKALIFDMLESFLFLYIFLSVKSSFIISRNYKLTDTWITQIECTQDQNNIMVDLIWWKESAEKKTLSIISTTRFSRTEASYSHKTNNPMTSYAPTKAKKCFYVVLTFFLNGNCCFCMAIMQLSFQNILLTEKPFINDVTPGLV